MPLCVAQALFVDEEGYLLEGPNMNCGIVTKDLKLVVPPFERCLAGITVQRLMTLVEENVRCGACWLMLCVLHAFTNTAKMSLCSWNLQRLPFCVCIEGCIVT